MPIDAEKAKALEFPPFTVDVERGRLKFFAQSIGETNPVYSDVNAARAAGHKDVLVPPTFFFSLTMEAPSPFGYLNELGIDLNRILHGEQRFSYLEPAYAGDSLTVSERIVGVESKRDGAMELMTKEAEFKNGDTVVARTQSVVVVRNPEVTS